MGALALSLGIIRVLAAVILEIYFCLYYHRPLGSLPGGHRWYTPRHIMLALLGLVGHIGGILLIIWGAGH